MLPLEKISLTACPKPSCACAVCLFELRMLSAAPSYRAFCNLAFLQQRSSSTQAMLVLTAWLRTAGKQLEGAWLLHFFLFTAVNPRSTLLTCACNVPCLCSDITEASRQAVAVVTASRQAGVAVSAPEVAAAQMQYNPAAPYAISTGVHALMGGALPPTTLPSWPDDVQVTHEVTHPSSPHHQRHHHHSGSALVSIVCSPLLFLALWLSPLPLLCVFGGAPAPLPSPPCLQGCVYQASGSLMLRACMH